MGFTGLPVGAVGTTPQLGGPGLALIRTVTFPASATVSINGCFTSNFHSYEIVAEYTASTAPVAVNMRLRSNGSDDSSANYQYDTINGDNTSVSGTRVTAASLFDVLYSSAGRNAFGCRVFAPMLPQNTLAIAHGVSSYNTIYERFTTLILSTTTTYDGFTIYPASGTITGTLSVYGYRKE